MIEALLEEKEYKEMMEAFTKEGEYEREDALLMLLFLSYMTSGDVEKASHVLSSIGDKAKGSASYLYYKGELLLKKSEMMKKEEKILALGEAKSCFLDALEGNLNGVMEENAVAYLMKIEAELSSLLDEVQN